MKTLPKVSFGQRLLNEIGGSTVGKIVVFGTLGLGVYLGYGYGMAKFESFEYQQAIQTAVQNSGPKKDEAEIRAQLEKSLMPLNPPFKMKDIKITKTINDTTVEVSYKVEFFYPLFEKPHTLYYNPKVVSLATN